MIDNLDLEWSMTHIFNRDTAYDFVQEFQQLLCVYSPTVSQVYANYEFYYDGDDTLLVLPNPYAHHDTFYHIDIESACRTQMQIIPGEIVKRSGYQLLVRGSSESGNNQVMPLEEALKYMFSHIQEQHGALPVLMNGDLKELKRTCPFLNLHMIRTDKLTSLSQFEIESIRQTVMDHIDNFIHHHIKHSGLKHSQVMI